MDRVLPTDLREVNKNFYAQNAKCFKMSAAHSEYNAKSARLREMEELGAAIITKSPEFLSDDDQDFLKRYQALKAEVEELASAAFPGPCLNETGAQSEESPEADSPGQASRWWE